MKNIAFRTLLKQLWLVSFSSAISGLPVYSAVQDFESSEQWGFPHTASYPWMATPLGWVYISDQPEGEPYWFWQNTFGWLYSSPESFPTAYSVTEREWILFDLTERKSYKYFDLGKKKWFKKPRPGIVEDWVFGRVPENLSGKEWERGVGSSYPSYGKIGGYYYEEHSSNPMGGLSQVYFYSETDGLFHSLEESTSWSVHTGEIPLFGWRYKIRIEIEGEDMVVTKMDTTNQLIYVDRYPLKND